MSGFKDNLLVGKTAFVAGGTSGINLGIAKRFAELGAKSDPTAPSATKPRWSALLHQGRHACPDAKEAGLSHKDRTKVGDRLTPTRSARWSIST